MGTTNQADRLLSRRAMVSARLPTAMYTSDRRAITPNRGRDFCTGRGEGQFATVERRTNSVVRASKQPRNDSRSVQRFPLSRYSGGTLQRQRPTIGGCDSIELVRIGICPVVN